MIFVILSLNLLFAEPIKTNEMVIYNAPKWVKRTKVEKLTDKIQNKLEWKTRKISVFWYSDLKSFTKAHSLGPFAAAVTVKTSKKVEIHMGPLVTKENYQQMLGHELIHVIIFQKYRGSIPRWLEEGLANFYSRQSKVNYKKLASKKLPENVLEMGHPFKENKGDLYTHYEVSQALAEMLDKKCDLENLLRLSVKKNLEDYIRRTCEIKDINMAFKQWIKKKSKNK